jgi:hypothetical protein
MTANGILSKVRVLAATNPRLVLALALAAAALGLFVAVIAMGGALRSGLAPWPGIAVVVMATAAFVLPRGQGSFLLAGMLAASGAVGLVHGLARTDFLAAVEFPGPVFGVIIGLPLLALGVAKGVETARAHRSRGRAAFQCVAGGRGPDHRSRRRDGSRYPEQADNG